MHHDRAANKCILHFAQSNVGRNKAEGAAGKAWTSRCKPVWSPPAHIAQGGGGVTLLVWEVVFTTPPLDWDMEDKNLPPF